KFTMEHDFFQKPFRGSDIELFVPEEKTQKYLHQKIVDELENGIVKPDTKHEFLKIVEQMADVHQLDGLILGCTELPMIIKEEDTDLKLLNTTDIHVDKMIEAVFS